MSKIPQRRKFTDAEIVAAIEGAEKLALGAVTELESEREDALEWYNREPESMTYQEGRSGFVDGLVADQIEMMVPQLVRVFASGVEVGRFEPVGPEDEEAAETQSEVVNWALGKAGYYEAINAAIRDALLLRNGYIKLWWESSTATVEERYYSQSDEELALLLQDVDVEVIEHSEQAGPLGMMHDVVVRRKTAVEGVAIAAVPPDELLVSHRQRSVCLREADFVQHRRQLSIAEVRDLGYDVADDIGSDGETSDSMEFNARQRFDEMSFGETDETSDPSRRIVTLRETFIRFDPEGTGESHLWRYCVIGKTIVHQERADMIPIAAFAPLIYPHSHVGTSVYALISDLAVSSTQLWRQLFDNLYLQNNTRVAVDANRVNLDDLLVSRPGGIVRVEGGPGDAVMPLVSPGVVGDIAGAIEQVKLASEGRTGVARINQGHLDPNALNRTATGVQLMQSAGSARLELIARTLAGGIEDLFLIAHALLCKHSTKRIQMRMRNQWIASDPREWVKRTNFNVSVALGTGNPEAQMGKLTAIGQFMQQGAQIGLVGPKELYNWGVEFLRAAGYRSPDKFLREPPPQAQMPQSPPPEVMAAQTIAQGQVQSEQIKAQTVITKAQGDAQVELQREEIKQRWEYKRALLDVAARAMLEVYKQQSQARSDAMAAANGAQMEHMRAGIEADRDERRNGFDRQSEVTQALSEMVERLSDAMRGLDGGTSVQ